MRHLRKIVAIVSAAALAATLAFAGHEILVAASASPANHTVHIQGMVFRPQMLEIAAGDSVTWINDDVVPHAIKATAPQPSWQSPDLRLHASWTRKFQAGATYVCPYHPTMTGEIVIAPK